MYHSYVETFTTFSGIKSFHKFEFTSTTVYVYKNSTKSQVAKEFDVANTIYEMLEEIRLHQDIKILVSHNSFLSN